LTKLKHHPHFCRVLSTTEIISFIHPSSEGEN